MHSGALAMALLTAGSSQPVLLAQDSSLPAKSLRVRPASVEITVGESIRMEMTLTDAAGRPAAAAGSSHRIQIYRSGHGVGIDPSGRVTGLVEGEYTLVFRAVTEPNEGGVPTVTVPVTVTLPPVVFVEVTSDEGVLLQGHSVHHRALALHENGSVREASRAEWSSSAPEIATVDAVGTVRAVGLGEVTISAAVGGVVGTASYEVFPSPVATLELEGGRPEVRTGDVQHFTATVRAANGMRIADAPVTWSFAYRPDDSLRAPSGLAQIDGGRMVADVPGVFTAIATSGPASADYSFRVVAREAVRKLDVIGHGRVNRVVTSDIWVWEGLDGQDYAMTGSLSDGTTSVWDVTDPANIVKTDSIVVDARAVNDVKVSPDGRYGAISREGASDRRNGIVVLDLADPAHPRLASTYDEGLTGGVHNLFATNTHLFALSGGDKYVILDMSHLESPSYVSEYNHPDSRVHDVWVHDGVAYSSEWGTGVVVVDVGNGRWGGSIENPKFVTTIPTPTGATHAVFPYHQASTDRFLLIVGDERLHRTGLAWAGGGFPPGLEYPQGTGVPQSTAGYTQIFDFSDPENPVQLARYEVSEYGTHNMWVEDDILYQAYYEGGVRMVDISGDLMGNLYTQGREIAVIKSFDPGGFVPNAPRAWGVMPWKGHIFFSDANSGIWAVRLEPKKPVS